VEQICNSREFAQRYVPLSTALPANKFQAKKDDSIFILSFEGKKRMILLFNVKNILMHVISCRTQAYMHAHIILG